jgi:hypothetical protein
LKYFKRKGFQMKNLLLCSLFVEACPQSRSAQSQEGLAFSPVHGIPVYQTDGSAQKQMHTQENRSIIKNLLAERLDSPSLRSSAQQFTIRTDKRGRQNLGHVASKKSSSKRS